MTTEERFWLKVAKRAHLFLGTQADNLRDMCAKRRHWLHKRVAEKQAGAKP